MFRLLVAVAFLASLAQTAPQIYDVPILDGKIVGGEPTFIEKYPYQASLQYISSHICGSVIISTNYVLTAAHCTDGFSASYLTVLAGSTYLNSGGVVAQVAVIYQYPYHNTPFLDNDISVLQLASPLSFGASIAPIALPEFNQPIIEGSICHVSGWELLTELGSPAVQLQVVEVLIVSLEKCRADYGDVITERMVCAGFPVRDKDACQGDSGGPLVLNGTLIGLVSFGRGCANSNSPAVYTSVPALRNFITGITGL